MDVVVSREWKVAPKAIRDEWPIADVVRVTEFLDAEAQAQKDGMADSGGGGGESGVNLEVRQLREAVERELRDAS